MPRGHPGACLSFKLIGAATLRSILAYLACHITSIEESKKLASKQLVQVHVSYNLVQPSINSQQAKFQLDAASYCNRTIYCNQQNMN